MEADADPPLVAAAAPSPSVPDAPPPAPPPAVDPIEPTPEKAPEPTGEVNPYQKKYKKKARSSVAHASGRRRKQAEYASKNVKKKKGEEDAVRQGLVADNKAAEQGLGCDGKKEKKSVVVANKKYKGDKKTDLEKEVNVEEVVVEEQVEKQLVDVAKKKKKTSKTYSKKGKNDKSRDVDKEDIGKEVGVVEHIVEEVGLVEPAAAKEAVVKEVGEEVGLVEPAAKEAVVKEVGEEVGLVEPAAKEAVVKEVGEEVCLVEPVAKEGIVKEGVEEVGLVEPVAEEAMVKQGVEEVVLVEPVAEEAIVKQGVEVVGLVEQVPKEQEVVRSVEKDIVQQVLEDLSHIGIGDVDAAVEEVVRLPVVDVPAQHIGEDVPAQPVVPEQVHIGDEEMQGNGDVDESLEITLRDIDNYHASDDTGNQSAVREVQVGDVGDDAAEVAVENAEVAGENVATPVQAPELTAEVAVENNEVAGENDEVAGENDEVAGEDDADATAAASGIAGVGERAPRDVADDGMYLSYEHHVGHSLTEERVDRGPLKCKAGNSFYHFWDLSVEPEEVQNLVKATPIYEPLIRSYTTHNRAIISALIERWQPETNTIHSTVGELTITLDDVEQILRIPVVGEPMVGVLPKDEALVKFIAEALGMENRAVIAEMKKCRGKRLHFSWLEKELAGSVGRRIRGTNRKVTAENVARGYLLTLIGCTIFADKTGVMVSVKYLMYLKDLSNLGRWSWGSATLARLYRYLGSATHKECKEMGGYMTLLEAWAYEHFPGLQPKVVLELEEGMYRFERWHPKARISDAEDVLVAKRHQLDELTFKDVIWMPYRTVPEKPHEIAMWTGVLVDDFFTEPYHPERVLRQFGYVQTKPKLPYTPKLCARGPNHKKYQAKYAYNVENFINYEYHTLRLPDSAQVSPQNPNQHTAEYREWYNLTARTRLCSNEPPQIGIDTGAAEKLEQVMQLLANLRLSSNKMTKATILEKVDEALKVGGHDVNGKGKAVDSGASTSKGKGADAGTSQKKRKGRMTEVEDAAQPKKRTRATSQVESKKTKKKK